MSDDPVNSPKHYKQVPGIECIEVTEHFGFLRGNAIKYLWRADHKNGLEDLRKAVWYVQREIANMEAAQKAQRSGETPRVERETGGAPTNARGRLIAKRDCLYSGTEYR